jgi:hypothetical protein
MVANNTHSRFFALIKQLPHADKEQLVFDSSGGKTTSLNEFVRIDFKGYTAMLTNMQRMADEISGKKTIAVPGDAIEAEKRRYRHIILNAMSIHGIHVVNHDYSLVNDIIQSWARTDKTMKTMTLEELKKISRCVHKVIEWYLAKAAKRRILELSN